MTLPACSLCQASQVTTLPDGGAFASKVQYHTLVPTTGGGIQVITISGGAFASIDPTIIGPNDRWWEYESKLCRPIWADRCSHRDQYLWQVSTQRGESPLITGQSVLEVMLPACYHALWCFLKPHGASGPRLSCHWYPHQDCIAAPKRGQIFAVIMRAIVDHHQQG
jgi:hypothetical protein